MHIKKGGDGKMNQKLRVFSITVAAVIVKEKKVLLLKRREDEDVYPGIWELPSGKRKFGETSTQALLREVKEETGLSIVVERPISVFEYVVETPTEIRDTTQINFLAFLLDPEQGVVINTKEHERAQWFSKEELYNLNNITEEVKKCVIKALEEE
jgi:8-oxo-dGTP diphosphatase